ncbi:PorP/SprF family type IX secretion system membrane protein [Robiginitalea sediminis]|uniref:PorP/SprF family type IX secretion system membrane protein n=1 Tax=Robiginitalea sediminis TaxID=1982593 RepID=UPI000B4AA17B|nr:PorP/SprF family type IX secretion system membrane protein [Robiginitalea sediminis]
MGKRLGAFLLFLATAVLHAQDALLPPDLRQQNLQYINASLMNPVFSLDQESPHRIGFWSRWQWQTIDADPTTIFLTYSASKETVAYGGGFFQHNTGVYKQTGGVLNYAFDIPLSDKASISFGANLFGFMQEIADNRFFINEPILPFSDGRDEFILQLAPAIRFNYDQLGVAVTSENLFDFNITRSGAVTESNEKILAGMLHYTFETGDGQYLRPLVYAKRIPGYDTQFGLNALWMGSRYWIQGGYNSFYGASAGLGGVFFGRLSLGGMLEFASSNSPEDESLTYGLVASYDMGKADKRKKVVGFDIEEDLQAEAAMDQARREAEMEAGRRDSLQAAEAARQLAEQRTRDSLAQVARAAELADAERKRDSIARAEAALALKEEVKPREGERYQEVVAEDGLQPGFYLIANVFGTKRYYEAFMKNLADQGLQPKSFYREANSFNYVYLERYDSIEAARRARDSRFGGRYTGELWIFRVK